MCCAHLFFRTNLNILIRNNNILHSLHIQTDSRNRWKSLKLQVQRYIYFFLFQQYAIINFLLILNAGKAPIS